MNDSQILIWILLAVLAWLIWRWLNPKETPEQRAERLAQKERIQREAAEADRRRQAAEAEARRMAEAERARQREEADQARRLVEQERAGILAVPLPRDILREMGEFLKAGQFFGEEHSPLAYVGYRVGKTNGLPVQDRHRRLQACFQIAIPRELADKYQDWGKPVSSQRFSSMCQHLKMLADLRRSRPNFDVAVADWEADLQWFKAEYSGLAQKLACVNL